MKLKTAIVSCGLLLVFLFISSSTIMAEEKSKPFIPNKALCAKMLRFGKEAYMRGRYLEAKEYFRKAIQADPTSQSAWRYYDQAVIFALAERVEKDARLLFPGKSLRAEQPGRKAREPGPPNAATSHENREPEFKIVEDEGC